MKLVSSRTHAEIQSERAAADFSWALRDLTANLLRVVRGAGKAYLIPEQTVEVLKTLKAYHDVAGIPLEDHEMAEMLRFDHWSSRGEISEENRARRRAEELLSAELCRSLLQR